MAISNGADPNMKAAAWIWGVLCICCGIGLLNAQPLDAGYYNSLSHFCPSAPVYVGQVVREAISQDKSQAAKLLRLLFHDCFVRGCDASALIYKSNGQAERNGLPNSFSLGGFDVIDKAKERVEAACPRIVSCADIVALAARDSVVALGGFWTSWEVLLGRKDGFISLDTEARTNLPSPASTASQLIASFASKNLTKQDLVALSGAHTIGTANCTVIDSSLYPTPNPMYDPRYAAYLRYECPRGIKTVRIAMKDFLNNSLSNNEVFDKQYYINIQQNKGLFKSDNALYDDPPLKTFVDIYAQDYWRFIADFKSAMIAMGNIGVKTEGYVRKNCSLAFE